MIKKNVLLFAPMIGGGGVEKNLFLIANYFSYKFQKVSIISTSKEYKKKFNKNIEFITPKIIFGINVRTEDLKLLFVYFC